MKSGNSIKDTIKNNPYKSSVIATGLAGAGVYGLKQIYNNKKQKECMRIENKHERELCLSKYT
jgi:hypothetical protein